MLRHGCPSFGCEDKAKWTYFGDAFFNAALRRANNLKDAFLLARSLVLRRELREGFELSHPQMAGGEKVAPCSWPAPQASLEWLRSSFSPSAWPRSREREGLGLSISSGCRYVALF